MLRAGTLCQPLCSQVHIWQSNDFSIGTSLGNRVASTGPSSLYNNHLVLVDGSPQAPLPLDTLELGSSVFVVGSPLGFRNMQVVPDKSLLPVGAGDLNDHPAGHMESPIPTLEQSFSVPPSRTGRTGELSGLSTSR